jgi:hypothetical protein
LLEDQGRWSEAPVFRQYAKPIMTVGANEQSRMRLQKMAVALNNSNLRYHARALYHADAGDAANLAGGFELSQWVMQNSAADALSSLSARLARGDSQLAKLIREEQDFIIASAGAHRSQAQTAAGADAAVHATIS